MSFFLTWNQSVLKFSLILCRKREGKCKTLSRRSEKIRRNFTKVKVFTLIRRQNAKSTEKKKNLKTNLLWVFWMWFDRKVLSLSELEAETFRHPRPTPLAGMPKRKKLFLFLTRQVFIVFLLLLAFWLPLIKSYPSERLLWGTLFETFFFWLFCASLLME